MKLRGDRLEASPERRSFLDSHRTRADPARAPEDTYCVYAPEVPADFRRYSMCVEVGSGKSHTDYECEGEHAADEHPLRGAKHRAARRHENGGHNVDGYRPTERTEDGGGNEKSNAP